MERGDTRRLCIFMPPRHGKSELASVRFPAWYIGKNPTKHIIACSYAQELASHFGREVRNLIQQDEYTKIFGHLLADDSTAKHRWNTTRGGGYLAAGVRGPITGRGADLLLIDDPVKSRKDAESEIYRDEAWDWYRGTAYIRLQPDAAIVLIQTRWHDSDLAGRILAHNAAEWDVLELPAILDGKALWPAWYDLETLEGIRDTIGPRDWSAQYQQQPAPDDGAYFQRSWIRYYDHLPRDCTLAVYGASDYAVTDGAGDYTVHGVVGVSPDDDIYLLDWWSGQTTSDEWVETAIGLMERHRPIKWAEEAGQIEKSIGPFLTKRMVERRVYCHREPFTSHRDKPTRARSIQARMAMGKVYFPRQTWADEVVHELLRFPAGAHDDQVDVMSLFGRLLDDMLRGKREKPPQEPPRGKTWDDLERESRLARMGLRRNVAYAGR